MEFLKNFNLTPWLAEAIEIPKIHLFEKNREGLIQG
jgi:hypothetical protein